MRDFGLTGFWFVYSSVFEGKAELLEIYRHFRTSRFATVDDFYLPFFETSHKAIGSEYDLKLEDFDVQSYLSEFPFYSSNDRLFRYIRDDVLGAERYHQVMGAMMAAAKFDVQEVARKLWMDDADLKTLHGEGHVIGLHSYSHPTRLVELNAEDQRSEYERNATHLTNVLGAAPQVMSHPCGSYDDSTLAMLRSMGIRLGFCATMKSLPGRSTLEFAREDHANIMARLRS